MFYKCPKCGKVWQQPIRECVFCAVPLERVSETKISVAAISRITIPTLLHPKVPYFVLILEDEYGNKWAHKSVKKYNIGDEFKIEPIKDKKAVSIWRVKYDFLEAVQKVLECLGGIEVNKNSKILIAPTLVSPKYSHLGENIEPAMLDGLIKFLLQQGALAQNIKVGGQSFGDVPLEVMAKKSLVLDVCVNNKVNLLNLAKTKFVRKENKDFSFEISAELFENDLIINLPTMNLHSRLGVRGASENLIRLLSRESYLLFQYFYSPEQIFNSIGRVLPENLLNIGDAVLAQKKDKFTVPLNLILASYNMLNLDRVFDAITMGKADTEDIQIAGRQITEVQHELG